MSSSANWGLNQFIVDQVIKAMDENNFFEAEVDYEKMNDVMTDLEENYE